MDGRMDGWMDGYAVMWIMGCLWLVRKIDADDVGFDDGDDDDDDVNFDHDDDDD